MRMWGDWFEVSVAVLWQWALVRSLLSLLNAAIVRDVRCSAHWNPCDVPCFSLHSLLPLPFHISSQPIRIFAWRLFPVLFFREEELHGSSSNNATWKSNVSDRQSLVPFPFSLNAASHEVAGEGLGEGAAVPVHPCYPVESENWRQVLGK